MTERQLNHCQAQRLYLWRGPTQLRGLPLSPNSQAAGRAGAALDLPSVEGRIALSQLCERRQLARRSNRASGESFPAKGSGPSRGRQGVAISSRLCHVTLGPKSILLHATGRQSGTTRVRADPPGCFGPRVFFQSAKRQAAFRATSYMLARGYSRGTSSAPPWQPLAPDSMCV